VANLGIAVDIGTTTLVVALVDLESGDELAVASARIHKLPMGTMSCRGFTLRPSQTGLATMQRH